MEYMLEQLQCIRNYFEKRTIRLEALENLEWTKTDDLGKTGLSKKISWNKEEFDEILQSPVFTREFSDKLLDRKFRELLEPFIFDHGEKTIYCKLQEDSEDDNFYLFSACTSAMSDVDKAFFQKRETYSALDILYKPYLYELSVEKIGVNLELKKGIWYEIRVTKKDEENNSPDTEHDGKKGNVGLRDLLIGHLTYMASPGASQTIYVDWKNDINEVKDVEKLPCEIVINADEIKSNTCKTKVQKVMNEIFENAITDGLKICRVGQANYIYGRNEKGSQKKYFAFDIGFPTGSNLQYKVDNGSIDMEKSGIFDEADYSFQPDLIMVSHWHQDHYRGAYMLERALYRRDTAPTWIAQIYNNDEREEEISANRLVAYLLKLGKIVFMPEGYCYKSGNYRLCCGTWNPKYEKMHLNKIDNHNSLLLQLNNTLLPGDCACECWPNSYLTLSAVDNIVVPHHGSKFPSADEVRNKLALKASGGGKAYICVGKENRYHHPNDDKVNLYKTLFQEVIQTKDITDKLGIWILNP